MILQNDTRIKNEWVHEYGCAIMSIFFIVNQKTGKHFSPAKIDIYIEQMKQANCFTEDMLVYWERAFQFMGIPAKYLGKKEPKYKLKKGEFSIAQYHNPATGHTHFVVGEKEVISFDPLGQSITCRDGELVAYRVFKVE